MGQFNAGLPGGMGNPASPPVTYVQSQLITSSQSVPVPTGTKRIEALLAGGGGGGQNGSSGGGGGFGGAGVFEIPVVGSSLDIVIGAGGTPSNKGSATTVSCAGTLYAKVGGGGAGAQSSRANCDGEFGGSGGGLGGSADGGNGGTPPIGKLIWHPYPGKVDSAKNIYKTSAPATPLGSTFVQALPAGAGAGAFGFQITTTPTYDCVAGQVGSMGGGSGGGSGYSGNGFPGPGGGGSALTAGAIPGTLGGGGAAYGGGGSDGGSMATVTVWGYTGGVGSVGGVNCGGGGGGLFGAAGVVGGSTGGAGGLGGGGGGAGITAGGAGGNGAAVLRFYF